MSIATDLLTRIENFLEKTEMSERVFGLKVANNHKFVSRLRSGHDITTGTADRAIALIEGRPLPPPSRQRNAQSEAA